MHPWCALSGSGRQHCGCKAGFAQWVPRSRVSGVTSVDAQHWLVAAEAVGKQRVQQTVPMAVEGVRSVGVEEELLLVDAAGRSAAIGERVVDAASGDEVQHEFKLEQTEIASDPCVQLAELRTQLRAKRRAADDAAREVGGRAVAIGTNPSEGHPHPTDDERYRRMSDEFGMLASQQLTCGQHVHVAVDSRAEAVAVMDRIRDWLPLLRAVSGNSPFWQGADTGYASYRSVLWNQWPTSGPIDVIGDEATYDGVVEDLIATGAALDIAMIYFDARPSANFPTLEIRVADVCTDLGDSVLIAALCRALVETAAREWRGHEPAIGTPTAVLRAASWRAARHGLSERLVHPRTRKLADAWSVLDALVRYVSPALGRVGDLEIVAEEQRRLRQVGSGAERQRAAFRTSPDLQTVVTDAAERTLAG